MAFGKILRDGSHLFGGKAGAVLVGLLNLMILTRILTTEEMGSYSLFLMVVNLALILGTNWFDTSIIRYGREEFVERGGIQRSFWARTYLYAPCVVILIACAILFRKHISEYIGLAPAGVWLIVALFILTGALNGLSLLYQSIDQMRKSAYGPVSQRILYLVALLLFYFNVLTPGIWPVLVVANLSFLVALGINLIGFDTKLIRPHIRHRESIRKVWSYSWPQLIGFVGLYAINYVDIYTIKRFLSLEDVGVYSVAYGGFTNITGFIMLINTIAMPLVVQYRTNRQYALIRKYLRNIPLLTVGWTVLVLLGVLLAEWIVPLFFSENYAPAVPSFQVLLFASIFHFVVIALLPVMNSFDLVVYIQAFNLIKAAVNIVADFALVPRMGIIGAAYGTLLSYLVGMILTTALIYSKRQIILEGGPREAD